MAGLLFFFLGRARFCGQSDRAAARRIGSKMLISKLQRRLQGGGKWNANVQNDGWQAISASHTKIIWLARRHFGRVTAMPIGRDAARAV
jgi:hypothetical protein